MRNLRITRRADGLALLHNWRTGSIYYGKNRTLLLRDWSNVIHRNHCNHIGNDGILVYDCRRGIPAADGVFDAIYSCHVVEHLEIPEVDTYLSELHRVLKPGGVCRVSTPDLAREAREYVRQFDRCVEDLIEENDPRYELAVCTLIDQFVRRRSGGALLAWFQEAHSDREYARERFGDVYREFLPERVAELPAQQPYKFSDALREGNWRRVYDTLKVRVIGRVTGIPALYSGESNRWQFDEYSLGQALRCAGFVETRAHTFDSSGIPGWRDYQIDTSFDGKSPIEHSLYMEAVKPDAPAA